MIDFPHANGSKMDALIHIATTDLMFRSTNVFFQLMPECKTAWVRKMNADDGTILGHLLYQSFKDTLHRDRWPTAQKAIKEATGNVRSSRIVFDASFLAFEDDKPLACTLVRIDGGIAYLAYCCTHPDFRKRGLAEDLIKMSLWAVSRKGFRNIYLEVHPKNTPAVDLYNKLGFSKASREMLLAEQMLNVSCSKVTSFLRKFH